MRKVEFRFSEKRTRRLLLVAERTLEGDQPIFDMFFHQRFIAVGSHIPGFQVFDQIVMRVKVVAEIHIEKLKSISDVLDAETLAEIDQYDIFAVFREKFME